jgi:hypothetical protein
MKDTIKTQPLTEFSYNGTDYDLACPCAYCGEVGYLAGGKSPKYVCEGKEVPLHKECREKYLRPKRKDKNL